MTVKYILDDSPQAPRNPDGNPTRVVPYWPDGVRTVKHVKGPGGVHDVPDDHPSALAVATMDLGLGNGEGWRWATEDEVYDMYARHGVAVPGEFDTRTHATNGPNDGKHRVEVASGDEEDAAPEKDKASKEEAAVPPRVTPRAGGSKKSE